jgi:hypothetical protein
LRGVNDTVEDISECSLSCQVILIFCLWFFFSRQSLEYDDAYEVPEENDIPTRNQHNKPFGVWFRLKCNKLVCLDIANIKNRDFVWEQQTLTRIGNGSTNNDEYLVSLFVNVQQTNWLCEWKITSLKSYMKFTKMAAAFATGWDLLPSASTRYNIQDI